MQHFSSFVGDSEMSQDMFRIIKLACFFFLFRPAIVGKERQMAGSCLPEQSACPQFSSPPAVPSLFPASSPRQSTAVLGSGVRATDHQERTLYAETLQTSDNSAHGIQTELWSVLL